MTLRHVLLCLALLHLSGCVGSEPMLFLVPDPSRDGLEGRDGPHGAAWYERRALARVDEGLRYQVVYPAAADRTASLDAGDGGALPTVVMIHGGFVELERYRWIGRHLASRGYVTVLADHDANLALLSSDNSSAALDDVFRQASDPSHVLFGRLDSNTPSAVLGHSLGGVTAASLWAQAPERWGVLGILASFPAGNVEVESFRDRPTLHLVGTEDEPDAKREQGFDRFTEPRVLGVIDGMNHYAWTDDATDSELDGDGEIGRPNAETRSSAQYLMDTCLDAWMRADAGAASTLEAGVFPGVEVSR